MAEPIPSRLLSQPLSVINIGLTQFAADLAASGVPVCHVDWRPPAAGDGELAGVLARLLGDAAIAAANREAVARMLAGEPVLIDVVPASHAMPALGDGKTILHAGPPIGWDRMCGPMRGAIAVPSCSKAGPAIWRRRRRWRRPAACGFDPNHHFGAVGPMTGMTTRSSRSWWSRTAAFGNRAYCTINEGLGKVMRFGGNDAEVLERLAWLRDVLGPALGKAVRAANGVPLKPLIARGLTMGDEMHQRNVACSSLLLRELAPWLARTSEAGDDAGRVSGLHRRQRPVLPQRRHGDGQGA